MKRLGVFFFYDKDGIVDRYIDVLLSGMKPYLERLVIVCNGKLGSVGREQLEKHTTEILIRDNTGFDVWAYKYALEYLHLSDGLDCDELIMFNFTIYGPIFPFSEMFSSMENQDLDFWGITKYHKLDFDPMKKVKYGYIPEHIQSHFIAIRKSLFNDKEFIQYWKNIPPVTNYDEAVSFHEAIFTKHFSDLGFSWKTYIDTTPLDDYSKYPLMFMPLTLVKKYRCPILKRKTFFLDYWQMINESSGAEARGVLAYIQNNSLYDTRLIFENIIRSENQSNWMSNLQLVEVIPASQELSETERCINLSQVCVALYITGSTITDSIFEYLNQIPDECELVIISSPAMQSEISSYLDKNQIGENCVFIQIPEITGETEAFLSAADRLSKYKYVCFVHDKLDTNRKPFSIGLFHLEQCYQNLIFTPIYIKRIVSLFEKNDLLGIAFPPQSTFGYHGITYAHEWQLIYDDARKLLTQLHINVPNDKASPPICTPGNMFWYRTKALQNPLFSSGYNQNMTNSTETMDVTSWIYSLIAQSNGYYSAWVMNDCYAKTEISNLDYLFRRERSYSAASISLWNSLLLYLKIHYPRLAGFLKRKKSLVNRFLAISRIRYRLL